MLLSMIHTALDASLYARTVNGVRHYFIDRGAALQLTFKHYLKMPIAQNRPHYFHIRSFFWQVILVAVVNSVYVCIGVSSFYYAPCVSGLIVGLASLGQFCMYWVFCRQREDGEIG